MKQQNLISCKECKSQACFLKQHGSSFDESLIETSKYQTDLLKGEYIINENDPILGLYFVQHGKVKIFSSGLNKSPQIVRLAHEGESLCFRGWGRTTYLTSSVALEDSRVCFFESDTFLEACNGSALSTHLISHLSGELDVAENRLKCLMQMNVREKTAEALLFIKKSFGTNVKNELDVYISRKDIAAIAGTSEELIIRQLSDFEKENLIERRERGSKIALLNEKGLDQLICKYNGDS